MTTTTTTSDPAGQVAGTESSLSNWVGPYVTDMLGRGQALANEPFMNYGGPLTAGPSDLQNQAFTGIANLTLPDDAPQYSATNYGGDTFDVDTFTGAGYTGPGAADSYTDRGIASSYMNPFISNALEPTVAELIRQNAIQRNKDRGRLAQAGAYGGGRQAIMESEANRNLERSLADVIGKGYASAYDRGATQYNTERDRGLNRYQTDLDRYQTEQRLGLDQYRTDLDRYQTEERNRQLEAEMGQRYGLDSLRAGMDLNDQMMSMGDTQRAIEAEGIDADRADFEAQRLWPYKQVQYMQSLLQGLPVSAQSNSFVGPSDLSNYLGTVGGIGSFLEELFGTLFGTDNNNNNNNNNNNGGNNGSGNTGD